MNSPTAIESKHKVKPNAYPNPTLVFVLALTIFTAFGCKKDSASPDSSAATTTGASSSHWTVDTSNLKLINDTETKERQDFQASIILSVDADEFQKLESMAADFRTNKVRFRDGSWKLRWFYITFSDYYNFTEAQYVMLIQHLERWAKAEPRSVTPRLALAEAYHGYAWLARSSETADKVSQEQWQLMAERHRKGLYWLDQAGQLGNDPALYAITLQLYLGENVPRETYEKVFNAGVKNAPDFDALYEFKAYYLFPRWYGEPGEWEQFTRKMTSRTDIPGHEEIFARVALYLWSLGYFRQEFSGNDASWEELKASFRTLEKNYPDSLEIKSSFCMMSARLYDYKEAREQMKLLDGNVDLSVWNTRENFLEAAQWLSRDDAALESERQQSKAQSHQ